MTPDPNAFLMWMGRLACAGVLIQSLEVWWNLRELRDDGLLGAGVGGKRGMRGRFSWIIRSFPSCAWLLGLRVVLATSGLVVPFGGWAAFGTFGGLVVLQLYYNWRFTMIAGNCETLFLICIFAVLAGTLPGGSPRLGATALVFVASQVAIAYTVAGADKLFSRGWRDGRRLLQILRDGSYLIPGGAGGLERRPAAARGLAWVIIALELLLAVAVFLPTPVFVALLAGGFLFHTTIAVAMGLHGFWWSLAAAYPALWYVHALVSA